MSETFTLFLYDADGLHDGGSPIAESALAEAFETRIKPAVDRGVEVRLVDSGDLLVFHAKGGKVVFPTREDCAGTVSS